MKTSDVSSSQCAKPRQIMPAEQWRALMTKKANQAMKIKKKKTSSHGGIPNSQGATWFRECLIGKGGFGSVFFASLRIPTVLDPHFPSEIAVKSAPLDQSSSLWREKDILSGMRPSVYVVHCFGHEITETDSGEKIYNLLLEYCSGWSLHDYIVGRTSIGIPLNELEIRSYTRDIVCGLLHLHRNRIVHCDIKPENILMDHYRTTLTRPNYRAKIADLGLAFVVSERDDESNKGIRGTSRYMSPEMVREKVIDWRVDIWALGCVVVEMMTGEPVWAAKKLKDKRELLRHIAYSNEIPEIPSGISDEAKDFLEKCFRRDVCGYTRWTAGMLLKHPFVNSDDF